MFWLKFFVHIVLPVVLYEFILGTFSITSYGVPTEVKQEDVPIHDIVLIGAKVLNLHVIHNLIVLHNTQMPIQFKD